MFVDVWESCHCAYCDACVCVWSAVSTDTGVGPGKLAHACCGNSAMLQENNVKDKPDKMSRFN